jgi:hypothetical protein
MRGVYRNSLSILHCARSPLQRVRILPEISTGRGTFKDGSPPPTNPGKSPVYSLRKFSPGGETFILFRCGEPSVLK